MPCSPISDSPVTCTVVAHIRLFVQTVKLELLVVVDAARQALGLVCGSVEIVL